MRRLGTTVDLLRIATPKRAIMTSSMMLLDATKSGSGDQQKVTRDDALRVWTNSPASQSPSAGTKATTSHPLPPSEMSVFTKLRSMFGSAPETAEGAKSSRQGVDAVANSTLPSANDSQNGVPWSCHERMDFYFSFWAPQGWTVREMVRENFVSIQVSPPAPPAVEIKTSPVHGISITAFAYHKKVKHPDSGALLRSFIKRFSSQVDPNLRIVQFYDETAEAAAAKEKGTSANPSSTTEGGVSIAHEVGKQIGGSVCEVAFSPRAGPTSPQRNPALGVCRAFYHPNGRFHYVVLTAVPTEEYPLVEDQIKYAIMATRETMSPVADSS